MYQLSAVQVKYETSARKLMKSANLQNNSTTMTYWPDKSSSLFVYLQLGEKFSWDIN